MDRMQKFPKPFGKAVLSIFVVFFLTISLVNIVFVYQALHTNTGVFTDNAYEKGLAYNVVLQKARSQPAVKGDFEYADGNVTWKPEYENHAILTGANAVVRFVRPVQDGYDFTLALKEVSRGHYTAQTAFPLKGLWRAELNAKFSGSEYRKQWDIIIK